MPARARHGRQVAVYAAVGALCAAVDVGLMQLLLHCGVGVVAATSAGFALALVLNFLLHLRVTFRSAWTVGKALRYALVVLANWLITLGLVELSVATLDLALPGKMLSIPVIAVTGFLLSKYWVFR